MDLRDKTIILTSILLLIGAPFILYDSIRGRFWTPIVLYAAAWLYTIVISALVIRDYRRRKR